MPFQTNGFLSPLLILQYHAYSLWLFTRSDLKTIVGPQTLFGLLCPLSGPVLTTNTLPITLEVLKQLPLVVFWVWINLLPFNMANQRQPQAIEEDSINKPWRAMPTKRLSPTQAKRLMITLYFVAIESSLLFGGLKYTLILIALGYYYNELGGADDNFIIRNLVNAAGFLSFGSGAAEVASKRVQFSLNQTAYPWFLIIGAIVFSTVQSQDMPDQEGDQARGRKTAPLVLGDRAARWSIAVPVFFWSCFCPWFLGLGMEGYGLSVCIGATVAARTVTRRTMHADEATFKIWNVWLVSIYLLPLVKRLGV